jgi:hypothetical protein
LSKIIENAKLRAVASCIVSYLDTEGLRHTVEVEADSLYEAAVLAIRIFRQHDCEPGQAARLEVEVRSSVIHIITPIRVHEWLNGGAKTPREAVTKERLRALPIEGLTMRGLLSRVNAELPSVLK